MFDIREDCKSIEELLDKVGDDYEIKTKRVFDKDTRKKISTEYINLPAAFDIETTSFEQDGEKYGTMYIWMLGINGWVTTGRTWHSFLHAIDAIVEHFELNEKRILPIYVHNLGFEFQWFRQYFTWTSVFSREKRSPLYATTSNGIEFRCSYMLTGTSLEMASKDLTKYKVQKQVGKLDYSKPRHSLTPLTEDEYRYCIYDVYCVMAIVKETMELYDDDVTKVPMTNTGKVRLHMRNVCFSQKWGKQYRALMRELTIEPTEEWAVLDRAFQGGFTHASYLKAGQILTDIDSLDFTSSYPAQLCAHRYPMSRGEKVIIETVDDIKRYENDGYLLIFNVRLKNVKDDPFPYDHYLSLSKCYGVQNAKIDNGRIISADQLETTTTSVQWSIIRKGYDFDTPEFGKCYAYKAGYLPTPVVQCILEYYGRKTSLKNVKGKEAEYQYFKGMANSCYGMMVQDPTQDETIYSDGWFTEKADTVEQINKYNNSKNRFTFYPWGIFCTAYAQRALWFGIREFGKDQCYSDTDSCKVENLKDHSAFVEVYNNWITECLEHACDFHGFDYSVIRPKTVKGVEKPLGVWDFDGHYEKFKTLGAKRYLYTEKEKGQTLGLQGESTEEIIDIHCTIAGVNKKKGAEFFRQQEQPFEVFDHMMEVDEDHSGRLISYYIDEPTSVVLTDYMGVEYPIFEETSVNFTKSSYNLTISPLYMMLLGSNEKGTIG